MLRGEVRSGFLAAGVLAFRAVSDFVLASSISTDRSWPAEARASVIAPIMVEIAEIASSRASPVEASVYWAATKSIITSNLIEKDFLVALSPRPISAAKAGSAHPSPGLSRCLVHRYARTIASSPSFAGRLAINLFHRKVVWSMAIANALLTRSSRERK